MRTSTSKRTRRTITVALASVLLAAPAAQARFDEGAVDARRTSPSQGMSVSISGGPELNCRFQASRLPEE